MVDRCPKINRGFWGLYNILKKDKICSLVVFLSMGDIL